MNRRGKGIHGQIGSISFDTQIHPGRDQQRLVFPTEFLVSGYRMNFIYFF